MKHSVTVHVTRTDGGGFFVTGAASRKAVGGLNSRQFQDETELRHFLRGLGVAAGEVDGAVREARKGTHSIPNVMLTEEEVAAHGLGPI